ncbi:MAG: adenylate/guanylate cyclase domain-containing protein [Actinomycetota bacterium]|nr:adenylate/guanylate cyclase domain-containing protein [Actinomycetota bacterium]
MNELPELRPSDLAPGGGLDIPALFERVEQMLLGGPREYTRAQVAEVAEMSPEQASLLWRALGFATVGDDEVVFTSGDANALRQASFLSENLIGDDELRLAITRLLGRTFSRLASWQGQLLIELVRTKPELLASEASVIEFVEGVVPVMQEIQAFVWRRQLVAYFSRIASHEAGEISPPGVATVAVGFVDMAGFTTLTRKASEVELRELLEAFEATATDVVGTYGGRIVKTIGDEILFVADTAAQGALTAVSMQDAARTDERLPPLRIGIAAGPVVSRLGDVYGTTVNIASRLTSICRPGWVLVDRVMAETLREDSRFTLRSRRPESVRGYHHLRQWRLRRADEGRPDAKSG